MNISRVILLIFDAAGVGALPDAEQYGDAGAATLPHIALSRGGLTLPTCERLGLGNIVPIKGVETNPSPLASYGKMAERSPGKDSTTGHWEIGGLILEKPFPVFPNGFPKELVTAFEQKAGVKTVGNIPASGTEIIERLGKHHLDTGELILYTSADSVFQLAAHDDIIPLDRLYTLCQIARELCVDNYAVGRVIARPFIGQPGEFTRTPYRKDFSVLPPEDTILDLLVDQGHKTLSIGKIYDLFASVGITTAIPSKSNDEGMRQTIDAVRNNSDYSLIFTNLVDGDQLWGHRRDAENFALALERFDSQLPELLSALSDTDLLIVTADHGCDPTYTKHTDHTREYVPLLVYNKLITKGTDLGVRDSFTDIAKTITDVFKLKNKITGISFLQQLQESLK